MPISFYEARQLILDTVPVLAVERVPLLEATGRAVAEDIVADQPLPVFNNSAMDGYGRNQRPCNIPLCLCSCPPPGSGGDSGNRGRVAGN